MLLSSRNELIRHDGKAKNDRIGRKEERRNIFPNSIRIVPRIVPCCISTNFLGKIVKSIFLLQQRESEIVFALRSTQPSS